MKKPGFTLIELLVVIGIILVLLGLTSVGVLEGMKKAKLQKAKTDIHNILSAVKLYRMEIGVFPGGISEAYIGRELSWADVEGAGASTNKIFGPYFQFTDSNSSSGALKDPWGHNYKYDAPGVGGGAPGDGGSAVSNGFAVVWSDGTSGGDKIGTWQ